MQKISLFLLMIISIMLVSCKKNQEAIAKKWQIVHISSPQMEAYKDSMIYMYREIAKEDTSLNIDSLVALSEEQERANYENSLLDLNKDGNYTLQAGQDAQTGKWKSIDENHIAFTVTEGNQEITTKFIVQKLTEAELELLEVTDGDTLTMTCVLKK